MTTTPGTHVGAFTPLDWAMFLSIGLIWGSSFLLIAIGLDAFEPGLITWLRIIFGASVLWLVPAARKRDRPKDFPRLVAISVAVGRDPVHALPVRRSSGSPPA